MNSAFAIGRLCDFEAGCKRMLSLKTSDQMVYIIINHFIVCCTSVLITFLKYCSVLIRFYTINIENTKKTLNNYFLFFLTYKVVAFKFTLKTTR